MILKPILIKIAFLLVLFAFLYSLAGVAMAYWVAALPGATPERIRLNFLVWVPATVVTLMGCIGLGYLIGRDPP